MKRGGVVSGLWEGPGWAGLDLWAGPHGRQSVTIQGTVLIGSRCGAAGGVSIWGGVALLGPAPCLTPPLRQHICRYLQAEADRKERPDFREGWRGAFKMVRGGDGGGGSYG